MRKLLLNLASLQLAVILLFLLLVALSTATIVESVKGTAAAGTSVYYALWFQALMGLIVANVLASIAIRYPWGRQRVGFLLTHGALIVILVGSAVTYFVKIEGRLALWEGETSSRFERLIGSYANPQYVPYELPFAVKLHDFQIDTYQGTQRPAMFRSKVEVADSATGNTFPYDIEMNKELAYRGWKLFQSSYQQVEGREMTVLSVSRDPGQPIVFIGFAMLIAGMCVVLGTRISQARHARLYGARGNAPFPIGRGAGVILLLALAGAGAAEAASSDAALRRLPVQHDGRVMPLDTLAREAVWNVTGKTSWQGLDPVTLVVGWTADPQKWANTALVELDSEDLALSAGLPPGANHASYMSLVSNQYIMGLMQQARQEAAEDRPRHGALKDAEALGRRLVWMQGFLNRTQIRPIPPVGDPTGLWSPPANPRSAAEFESLLLGARPEGWPSEAAIKRELRYNGFNPTRVSWWLLLGAFLFSVLGWVLLRRWLDVVAVVLLLGGFAMMTWGILVRWQIAGRIPASNMYESLLFLGWGAGLFALIAVIVLRNRLIVVNAAAGAAVTMLLTDVLPIDGFIHPMPPVLSGTPWLAIHVPIIMTSYAVFALGVVFAHMQIGFTIFSPGRRELISKMSELLYWYTHVGSILLITGIISGSVWAAESWGRYWGWDPKEVWSLVAFLAYTAILHARWERMLGSFGVAAWSIVAFQTILMTYLGVNFVLSAGLHSYGFGSSSIVNWMAIVALAELAFLAVGRWAEHRRVTRSVPAMAAEPLPRT
ncbi:MAG: cytochrome c biogenesis protein CcsA [Acidobacteriota bacterium]|nr:cytochrome c biogenesis protein CcsA [Acidobacteriota bacterium]